MVHTHTHKDLKKFKTFMITEGKKKFIVLKTSKSRLNHVTHALHILKFPGQSRNSKGHKEY